MKNDIRNNQKVMEENCICECGQNMKILKHFELCEICQSEGYHIAPKELNKENKN